MIAERSAPASAITAPVSSACWKPRTNWSGKRGSVCGTISAAATIAPITATPRAADLAGGGEHARHDAGFVDRDGDGVIHVPLLARALGFPTHLATATSHFVLAIIAGSGALTHVVAGSFAHGHGIRRALCLSVGVVAGAQLGARLSLRASGRAVETLLGLALLALAARLLVGPI
jgi:hypothetical protein